MFLYTLVRLAKEINCYILKIKVFLHDKFADQQTFNCEEYKEKMKQKVPVAKNTYLATMSNIFKAFIQLDRLQFWIYQLNFIPANVKKHSSIKVVTQHLKNVINSLCFSLLAKVLINIVLITPLCFINSELNTIKISQHCIIGIIFHTSWYSTYYFDS